MMTIFHRLYRLYKRLEYHYYVHSGRIIEGLRKQGMKIGDGCCIFSSEFWGEAYLISIGDHVQITDGVKLFTHGGGWVFRDKIQDYDSFGKIVVGNNVYMGNNAMVMPGITTVLSRSISAIRNGLRNTTLPIRLTSVLKQRVPTRTAPLSGSASLQSIRQISMPW